VPGLGSLENSLQTGNVAADERALHSDCPFAHDTGQARAAGRCARAGRTVRGPQAPVAGAAAEAKARTSVDIMGSSALRFVLALVVAELANEGIDCAATFELPAVSRNLGSPQIPIALYLQAPGKARAEGPLGAADCRRGRDETPKSQVRVSENRSADFVCVWR
jgi:hypothetical protein